MLFKHYLSTTLALLLAATTSTTHAWVGTSSSAFGGNVLANTGGIQNAHSMEMKKSKPNLPPQMRGQYKQQKEMALQRKQMDEASKVGDDGLPVFNLFVRTKKANMWYPCGSFKGDDRSAALAKGFANNGIFAGISKKQLDSGISGSLFRDMTRLNETCCRAYPQLRKSRDGFEFGYKLSYGGLTKEQEDEICPVEPKEQKGVLDGIKTMFS
jgi:hypothetical protein